LGGRDKSALLLQKLARSVIRCPASLHWCIVWAAFLPEPRAMPSKPRANEDGTIEECVDEIDTFVDGLERYSVPVLAFALRVHLSGLLRAMVDGEICSTEDVRQFVHDLEQEALGANDA
jgi:hypothetical protein